MNRVLLRLQRVGRVNSYNVWRRTFAEETPKIPQNEAKTDVQGPMTWKGLALFTALGTIGLAYYSKERERRINGKVISVFVHIFRAESNV